MKNMVNMGPTCGFVGDEHAEGSDEHGEDERSMFVSMFTMFVSRAG